MRILYVSHSFPLPDQPLSNVGGMQRVAVGLYDALERRPDVDLDAMVLRTSWKWTGVRTPLFLFRLVLKLVARAKSHRADAIVFSSVVTASVLLLLGPALRRAGVRTAVIPVGRDVTLPNPLYQWFVPRILRAVDMIFPISRATATTCLERGAKAEQVQIIPCGVDLPPAPSAEERAAARASLTDYLRGMGRAVPDDALLLLSVGRHQERKGFHWFASEVMPSAPANAIYLLAGSGPMTPRIAEVLEDRGVGDRVFLLGRVPEEFLGRLYRGTDLFIMPNIPIEGDIEGFGVVMLEAGAAGLPVLAADLEGIRDVIDPGVNGVLVPSGDAGAFLEVIRVFGSDSHHALSSERSATHVHETFGWDAVAAQYTKALGKGAA